MSTELTFTGASGTDYAYRIVDPDNIIAVPHQAGNFLFGVFEKGRLQIIYAGESDSIRGTLIETTLWSTARQMHKAAHLCVRTHEDPTVRRAEARDLVALLRPPMNAYEEPPAAAAIIAKPKRRPETRARALRGVPPSDGTFDFRKQFNQARTARVVKAEAVPQIGAE